ncbi:MAG: LysR family transcriptional regulator [Anaerovoracaceae bacterium]
MNYSKYQYIIKVAEHQSITKAAKELYISQPALTKYINNLEEELGIKLFDRNVIPIRLTYAGERYIAGIKKILDIKNRLDKEIEEISEMKKGRLTVGISSNRGALLLPYILPAFKKECPGIDVKIVEGTFAYFEEMMLKGEIDISFTALPTFSSEVDYEIISENKIVLAVAKGHPILKGMDTSGNDLDHLLYIDPEKLNGQDFITLLPGQGLHRNTWQIFEKYNIKPGKIIETSSTNILYCLAAAGIGLAFVTDLCIKYTLPSMMPVFCTVEEPAPIRKNIITYKKDGYISISARKFIDISKEIVNTHPFFISLNAKDHL